MSTHTLIPHTTPAAFSTAGGAVNIGVDFTVRAGCSATAVWFFAPVGAQTVQASIWSYTSDGNSSGDGTIVGSATTANGTSLGWSNNSWVRIQLSSALSLSAGRYRAVITTGGSGTYPFTNGYYVDDPSSGNSFDHVDHNGFAQPNAFNGPISLLSSRQSRFTSGSSPAFTYQVAPAMANFWVDVEVSYTNPSHTWASGDADVFNLDGYTNRAAMLADGWDFLAPVNGGVWNSESGNVTFNPVTVPQVAQSLDWICRDLPSDWVSVQATIEPDEGTAAVGGYGIAVFEDYDDNAFAFGARGGSSDTYFPRLVDGMSDGSSLAAIDINIPAFDGTYLRLDRDPYTDEIMAQWSNDGTEWRYIRKFTHALNNPRLALVNYGGDGTQSVIWHSVTVVSLAQVATVTPLLGTGSVSMKIGDDDVLIGYVGTTKAVTTHFAGDNVAFTFLGDTFDPDIELHSGSTAIVSWGDEDGNILAVGTNPSIDLGYARERTIRMFVRDSGADAFDQVKTINCGFANDDAGLFMPVGSYGRPPMLVSGIEDLNLCTALVNFMAGRTPLAGHVDMSGMAALQQFNAFNARIESVDLTGCNALIRLCLEACAVSAIDLNPVSATLKDLRIATQYNSSTRALTGVTFSSITGNMAALYHYCVRDQPITNHIPNSKLPVVMQRWDWNTGATTVGAPTSSVLTSFLSNSNSYNQSTVDSILTTLVTLGADASDIPGGADWSPAVDLTGSAAPSSTGLAAKATLQSRGWTVLHT